MADTRRHRGPHPRDAELFAPARETDLRTAAEHLSWLLSRGYAIPSALKLVGDRFDLLERQRVAVMRSACPESAQVTRESRRVPVAQVAGNSLRIDGFNLLTTIEAALAGGVLLRGQDGCVRDMASMHGSYRRVEETRAALILISQYCQQHGVTGCHWWLDQPVSNSARLRTMMLQLASEYDWPWTVELLPDPDAALRQTGDIIVTADAAVLDDCRHWCNLAAEIVGTLPPPVWMVDFRPGN